MSNPLPGGERRLIIYADGAVSLKGSGAGIVIVERQHIIHLGNRRLAVTTNNEAEYAGLILALENAQSLGAVEVEICLDSEVVVGQMDGRWAVNSAKLKPLHQEACERARALPRIGYRHIPRERNALADALAVEAAAGRLWQSRILIGSRQHEREA
ncbi:MAG: ribonuclease HI family protein [Anaerolineae bacterium]|nr:ribonuclease HI family protein [Anaerolineae bacterium]